jgi:ABC-type sugar transport system permease subunit
MENGLLRTQSGHACGNITKFRTHSYRYRNAIRFTQFGCSSAIQVIVAILALSFT